MLELLLHCSIPLLRKIGYGYIQIVTTVLFSN